jgi:hypothetical protein
MNMAEHLERHLGKMAGGSSSSSLPGVYICEFRDRPSPGIVTLATLGMSHTILDLGGMRGARQELIVGCRETDLDNIAKLLIHVADRVLQSGRAILRGDVIPLGDNVAKDSALSSLYAAIPVLYPDELATLEDSSPPTVVVWLLPISAAEASLVRSSGW